MTTEAAIALVRSLVLATTEHTKAANSSRGSKRAARAERKSTARLLAALTSEEPTRDHIDRACGQT